MNELEEVRKWLRLGYETYGPGGFRAIASAMGLPTGKFDITSPGNGHDVVTTKESIPVGGGSRLYDVVRSDRLRPQRSAQSVATTCPNRPPRGSSGWRSYNESGDPDVFHCGFEGYLENREPTPERPAAECFYDEWGHLVDDQHQYAECRGTPNQYGADQWGHIWPDEGGVIKNLDSLLESRRHSSDWSRDFLRHAPRRDLKSLRPFRAPLPR